MHLVEDGLKLLDEGDIIEFDKTTEGEFYVENKEEFLKENKGKRIFVTNLHSEFVISEMPWLFGKYVVYKTSLEGGGHTIKDGYYEDGHRVFCEKMDKTRQRLNFYQSGSFTAMICNIEPIGKATLTYIEKPKNGKEYVMSQAQAQEIIMKALGEASICWSEDPTGSFDMPRAEKIAKSLLDDLASVGEKDIKTGRVDKLKEALKPFTELEVDESRKDDFVVIVRGITITAADVRKAREAMKL